MRCVENDSTKWKPPRRMEGLKLTMTRMPNAEEARDGRYVRVKDMNGRGHSGRLTSGPYMYICVSHLSISETEMIMQNY
jgi:hypothetical protein